MRTFFLLGATCLFSLVAFSSCNSPSPDSAEHAPQMMTPPAKVAPPTKRTVVDYAESIGRFQARQRVDVRPRVNGHLEAVTFTDGQEVKKGQTLFVIDPRPFQINLERAEAELTAAQAEFNLAEKEWQRSQSLRATQTISEEKFDQRNKVFLTSQASLQAVQAMYDKAKLDMEFTQVKAPIDGKAGRHRVSVGSLIDAQTQPLTTIVSVDPIYFFFEIQEADYLKAARLRKKGLEVHSEVDVRLIDEETFSHKGALDFLDNEVDAGTGTIEARAVIENEEGLLEHGMFGRVRLQTSEPYEAFVVPDTVVGIDQSHKILFVVGAENLVEARIVTIGQLQDDGSRVILHGLNADDRVVMSGTQLLRPGMVVNPIPYEMKKES